jgi:hypothetical protein
VQKKTKAAAAATTEEEILMSVEMFEMWKHWKPLS